MLKDLVRKNRSYRRFHQEAPVSPEALRELVDLARLSASGANRQPLKYVLSCDPEINARIFPHLAWANFRFLMCVGWSPAISRLSSASIPVVLRVF